MCTSSRRLRSSSSVRCLPLSPLANPLFPIIQLTLITTTGSVAFLLFSLTALATILYLPHHILFLAGRAWFYIHGDSALEAAKETAATLLQHAAASTTRAFVTGGTAGAAETARAVGRFVVDAKAEL